jgi:type I restriction enzyme R subunit
VDECHRSIYEVVLYFDCHDEAVTDGVNVDFDVYRIRTHITEQGATIVAGDTGVYVDMRHKLTRAAVAIASEGDILSGL